MCFVNEQFRIKVGGIGKAAFISGSPKRALLPRCYARLAVHIFDRSEYAQASTHSILIKCKQNDILIAMQEIPTESILSAGWPSR